MREREARTRVARAAWALCAIILSLGLASARAEPSPEAPGAFVLHMTLRDEANLTSVVVIGESASATNGYDVGIDVAAPPSPPGGSWLQGVSNPPAQSPSLSRLQTDMRPLAVSQAWNLSMAAGQATNATVEWEAAEVGGIDPMFIVTLTHNETSIDMRQNDALAVLLDGTSWLTVTVERGAPPRPPTDVRAAPDLTPVGGTRVTWTPPASGTVATGYDVFRQDQSGEDRFVAHVEAMTSFTDTGPALGEIVTYTIGSTNIFGRSVPSPATTNSTTLGTGLPHGLRAPGPENDSVLASKSVEIPAQSAQTPGVHETFVTIGRDDSQHTTISFVTPSTRDPPGGLDQHNVTILDAGLLPAFPPDVPSHVVETPSGSAGIVLATGRCSMGGSMGQPIARAALNIDGTRIVDVGAQPASFGCRPT